MPRAAALALVLLAACATPPSPGPARGHAPAPPPGRFRVEDAPRELGPALARAEAAVKALREQIGARLSAEVASAGIARAVAVCALEAPELAARISLQTGVAVGRTGARPRPGWIAPRPWVAALLQETAAKRAADVPAVVLDLGDRVGLLRPIALRAACLACHGPPERVLPEVKRAADGGPTPFAEGDLRGFFWAEARK